jgi:hypothetical protein
MMRKVLKCNEIPMPGIFIQDDRSTERQSVSRADYLFLYEHSNVHIIKNEVIK